MSKKWSRDDMRAAMKDWYEVADEVETIASKFDDAELSALAMGLAAFVHGPYERTRSGLQELLKTASQEMMDMGDALAKTNDQYWVTELEKNSEALAPAALGLEGRD